MAKKLKMRQDSQNRIKFDIYETLSRRALRFGDLLGALSGKGFHALWQPNRMTLWRYLEEAEERGHIKRNVRMEYSLTASGRAELEELRILATEREQGESLRTASIFYREQIHSEREIPPNYDLFRSRVFKSNSLFELSHALLEFPHPLVIPVTTAVYGSSELRSIFKRVGERAIFTEEDGLALSSKFLKREFQPLISQLVWRYIKQNIDRLYSEHARKRKGSVRPTLERILGFKFSFNMTFDGKEYLDSLARTFNREEKKRVGKRLVGLYLLAVVRGDCRLLEGIPILDGAGLIENKDLETLNNMEGSEREMITEMAWRYLTEGGAIG